MRPEIFVLCAMDSWYYTRESCAILLCAMDHLISGVTPTNVFVAPRTIPSTSQTLARLLSLFLCGRIFCNICSLYGYVFSTPDFDEVK